ncbi:MAG TPA: hypothetical protein VK728_20345 [Candidatus Sulfotelmatobacter sp.]|jgi:hypothetical protein|nr:hypothetical protein [Candidatus Sulfotelmatobacter sp.]
MSQNCKESQSVILKAMALVLSLAVALPASAYDYPLTSSAIRDAYFLGIRQGGLSPQFLAPYSLFISDLHQGSCTSEIRVETPFLQIVAYAGGAPNYSSQDAVKEFYDKPMKLRMLLNICYMRLAPPPNSVKIKVIQNKKEIVPETDTRLAYAEPLDGPSELPPNGEKVQLEFDAAKIDSSMCTIVIDTPNDQHVKVELDLESLR